MGFIIDKNGLRTNPKKVQALMDIAEPRNIRATEFHRWNELLFAIY